MGQTTRTCSHCLVDRTQSMRGYGGLAGPLHAKLLERVEEVLSNFSAGYAHLL